MEEKLNQWIWRFFTREDLMNVLTVTFLGLWVSLSGPTRCSPYRNGVYGDALNSSAESSRLAVFRSTGVLPVAGVA